MHMLFLHKVKHLNPGVGQPGDNQMTVSFYLLGSTKMIIICKKEHNKFWLWEPTKTKCIMQNCVINVFLPLLFGESLIQPMILVRKIVSKVTS